jgi:D-alanine transaminase
MDGVKKAILMSSSARIIYVNGAFVEADKAMVPVMDRGFLFGDGIYEVTAVMGGVFIDNEPHLARLDRSLREIGVANPHTTAQWSDIQRDLVARNAMDEGTVYIQVTRGTAERDFTCAPDLAPNVVMFTQARSIRNNPAADKGAKIITTPDLRWARRDIKSTALLAQVLAKFEAKKAGVAEAWMVQDGAVTEGASSSAFIITPAGEIVTRPLSQTVLPGITRQTVARLAQKHGLKIVERTFSVDEAKAAREAFFTSASTFVMPVIEIDGVKIGDGAPGPLTKELRKLYIEAAAG